MTDQELFRTLLETKTQETEKRCEELLQTQTALEADSLFCLDKVGRFADKELGKRFLSNAEEILAAARHVLPFLSEANREMNVVLERFRLLSVDESLRKEARALLAAYRAPEHITVLRRFLDSLNVPTIPKTAVSPEPVGLAVDSEQFESPTNSQGTDSVFVEEMFAGQNPLASLLDCFDSKERELDEGKLWEEYSVY